MKFPSYSKFVGAGGLSQEEADALDAAREYGRNQGRQIVASEHPEHLDAVMMGVLDVAAGMLATAYGSQVAADILAHVSAVCARNPTLVQAYAQQPPACVSPT